jgi:uncharacterized protein GlcG (DUF336 family)
MKHTLIFAALTFAAAAVTAQAAPADKSTAALLAADQSCAGLPTHSEFKAALQAAQKEKNAAFGLNMWGAVVNRAGIVCAVAFTGDNWGDQWPGSRIIAAQKAGTSNNFSLPKLAMATANLYSIAQPGGFAFGIQEANPIVPEHVYAGPTAYWGQANDPMVGERVGGFNVFGGGLPLYNAKGELLGALGTSGDSSCADHYISWRTRNTLKLDYVPAGLGPNGVDQIAFSGPWSQPVCGELKAHEAVVNSLPPTRKVAP